MKTKKYVESWQGRDEIPTQSGKSFKDYLIKKEFSESMIRIYDNGTKDFLEWITKHQYPIENIRYADLMNYIKHRQKKGQSKVSIKGVIAEPGKPVMLTPFKE